jgi:hypothetical protein
MDSSLVDALVGAFGPFLFPVALFAAGLIGYGVLFLADRIQSPNPTDQWRTERARPTPIVTRADSSPTAGNRVRPDIYKKRSLPFEAIPPPVI